MKYAMIFSLFLAFANSASAMEWNTDRPGSDIQNFDLHSADPQLCENACNGNSACVAWTYVKPGYQGQYARCWLKNAVPAPRSAECCVSGVKQANRYSSRWDKVAGPGGAWSTGWVPNHPAGCGHQAAGCACGQYNYCGWYANGAETYWWPNGCNGPVWKIKCTSVPQ